MTPLQLLVRFKWLKVHTLLLILVHHFLQLIQMLVLVQHLLIIQLKHQEQLDQMPQSTWPSTLIPLKPANKGWGMRAWCIQRDHSKKWTQEEIGQLALALEQQNDKLLLRVNRKRNQIPILRKWTCVLLIALQVQLIINRTLTWQARIRLNRDLQINLTIQWEKLFQWITNSKEKTHQQRLVQELIHPHMIVYGNELKILEHHICLKENAFGTIQNIEELWMEFHILIMNSLK